MRNLSFRATPLLVCQLLLLAGCGHGDPLNRGGEISGRVTIDNQPVTAGDVLFVSEDGKWSVSGPLSDKGTYVVKEPPLGKVRVAVQTEAYRGVAAATKGPSGAPAQGSGSPGMVRPDPSERGLVYKAIPKKYETVEESGLNHVIEKGNTHHDIQLTSK